MYAANENLCHLRASLEQVSHVENILLKLIEHFPLGILVVEFPSRTCLLMNETAKGIVPPTILGEAVYLHDTYLINEKGIKYDCVRMGSYLFTVGEKQYLSLLLTKQKTKEENYGKSTIRL